MGGDRQARKGLHSPSGCSGQSLLEVAIAIPLLLLITAYAVDFGYFFICIAHITAAAHSAVQYSIGGFASPLQSGLPGAGPSGTNGTVASVATADLSNLLNASINTTVQVCSKSLGMNANQPNCKNYGSGTTTYVPGTDPEAPYFVMQRVDVTYVITPPVPLTFFQYSLLPSLSLHRQVSMRVMD